MNACRLIDRMRWFIPALAWLLSMGAGITQAQLVPGTGQLVAKASDTFEDPKWTWKPNFPKSSNENDGRTRNPGGVSSNNRWYEAALRGQPDVVRRVPTPAGGLPGSEGALLLQTQHSGIPNSPSGEPKQDDFIANVGGYYSPSQQPSVVVRVHLPPFDQWEARTGNTFGFRAACDAPKSSGWRSSSMETYWPGMFIYFRSSRADRRQKEDSAVLLIRADGRGRDLTGPAITQTGWWTLGMSFTSDGQVHYYAHPGVEDLTEKDRITSQFPYGFRAQRFETYFFDLVNRDDGRTWSTPWVIDDAQMFITR